MESVQDRSMAQMPHRDMKDTIPGTEVMKQVDQDGDELTRRTLMQVHNLQSNNSGFRTLTAFNTSLVPHPSLDPADPLNWSSTRKLLAGITIAFYSLLTTTCAISMAPMFPLFAETFHLSEEEVPLITGVTVVVLGFSNFIAIPCSRIFGRRAVALSFGILFLVTSIWQAVAQNYASFMASRAVIGIAAAPSETLMVQVIADLWFIHERGFWMGVYFTSMSFGAFIGPVISGNIAERHGWRSFFWLSAGLIAFNLIMILFLFPETKYNRETLLNSPESPATPASTTHTDDFKVEAESQCVQQHVETIGHAVLVGKGRPSRGQFWLFQKPHRHYKQFIIRDFVGPIQAAALPIVLFASLNLMGTANLALYWNITESPILESPRYGFTPARVGLSNFGFAGGAFVGMLTAGPLSDWMVQRATVRNNGVREAEMRLPALIPFAITTVVGTVIGGIAVREGWDWPLIVVMGFGSSGLAVCSIAVIAIAYALDVYKPLSGEIMVVGTVFKNVTGFAMTYWVPPMVVKRGYILPLMIWFVFTAGPFLLAIPLYIWGKKLRAIPAFRGRSMHWE